MVVGKAWLSKQLSRSLLCYGLRLVNTGVNNYGTSFCPIITLSPGGLDLKENKRSCTLDMCWQITVNCLLKQRVPASLKKIRHLGFNLAQLVDLNGEKKSLFKEILYQTCYVVLFFSWGKDFFYIS